MPHIAVKVIWNLALFGEGMFCNWSAKLCLNSVITEHEQEGSSEKFFFRFSAQRIGTNQTHISVMQLVIKQLSFAF